MNRRLVFLSAVAAVMMVSVMAYGQRQGRGQGQRQGQGRRGGTMMMMMGRGGTISMLLRAEAVRKELGITDEQATKLRELSTGNRPSFGNLQEMSDEERQKAMADFRKAMADQEKKVVAILDKKQAKRLEEIRVQAMGSNVINDPIIGKKLGITDEQRSKFASARQAMMQKLRDEFSGGARPNQEAMAKMMKELEDAAKKAMTEEQAAKLEKMKGKPFDLSQIRPGRGRTGAGRAGAGRRGN